MSHEILLHYALSNPLSFRHTKNTIAYGDSYLKQKEGEADNNIGLAFFLQ